MRDTADSIREIRDDLITTEAGARYTWDRKALNRAITALDNYIEMLEKKEG